ncbi:DnaD domain protein [[Clostridium] aminophilum]|uniref:DnaD and phage-associated domain-containing protein n=1 Tax=[Clostridium] aminophilum TaxID=1526 RepID=A0A1I6JY81_9FIRM|nr:DnaD domain protein [[Clostridium] aminophilum]SFR83490.1 DnaD and phage-associated domain-containing protein [[Clostridium] aminophilum]
MKFSDQLSAGVTVVSNRFIDECMAGADGNFVKVYLYLLRHEGEDVTCASVADALECTEADVRRAAAYWVKEGILCPWESESAGPREETVRAKEPAEETPEPDTAAGQNRAGAAKKQPDMTKLVGDQEYQDLLYVAQRYLKKTFSHTDHMIFANLYQNIGIPAEVLEYLMEYCAQSGHSSMRYAEKIALDWNDRGFRTRAEAENYSANYSKGMFAVMKAFGLNDRRPATAEKQFIDRWLGEYGFSLDVVLEACDRTIARIHKPSFTYADGILKIWRGSGVKTLDDVRAQDEVRAAQENLKGKGTDGKAGTDKNAHGRARTRFDNFESHGYDYEDLVWELMDPAGDTGKKD